MRCIPTDRETDMNNLKRKVQIIVRMTPEEKNRLLENMAACHCNNMSRYIRQMALNGLIIYSDSSDIKERNYELRKIGTNINQIAHKVNETGSIYKEDIDQLKELMDIIWQSQRYILSDEP